MYVVVGVVVLIISNRREIQGRNYDAETKAFEAIRAPTCSAKIATIPPPQKKERDPAGSTFYRPSSPVFSD